MFSAEGNHGFLGGGGMSRVSVPEVGRVLDSFERDDSMADYSNHGGQYAVVADDSIDGENAIEHANTDNTTVWRSHPEPPRIGEAVAFWYRTGENADLSNVAQGNVMFAYDTSASWGSDNCYYLKFEAGDDQVLLIERSGGSNADIIVNTSTGGAYEPGEWVLVVDKWDDGHTFGGNYGDHFVEVYNERGDLLASGSGNNTAYTGDEHDGVAFRINSTTDTERGRIDYIHTLTPEDAP